MNKKNHESITIGIAGGSASGKGTIVKAIDSALPELRKEIFHMDLYFKKPLPKCVAPFSGRQYDDYNHPESVYMKKLLVDIENCLQSKEADIVIVEGLLVLQSNSLRKLLDLKIFVDADADERIVRRLKRNMAERGLSFDEIADYCLDSVRFRHQEFVQSSKWYADIIMNGSQWSETAIELLINWIKFKLEERR
ncbi:MAG: Uridine kinase [candidate division WS2 bacterium]|nr:Uridine kinase [Candidatus Psychracetigena formicireducens]